MSDDPTLRARNVALLIDADNASPSALDPVLTVLAELGTVNIRRAYGNWQKAGLKGWASMTHHHAIEPQQQFDVTKGKSATDMKMTIDAMDLLYRGHVHGFGIMSSDSDFMPLAMRIRQDGLPVYGFGTAKTPEAFRQACTRFIDVGALRRRRGERAVDAPAASPSRRGSGQASRRRDQGLQARRARLRQLSRKSAAAPATGPRSTRATTVFRASPTCSRRSPISRSSGARAARRLRQAGALASDGGRRASASACGRSFGAAEALPRRAGASCLPHRPRNCLRTIRRGCRPRRRGCGWRAGRGRSGRG